MKWSLTLIACALVAAPAAAEDAIPDEDLGLSRTSVFDIPEPSAYRYDGTAPAIPEMSSLEAPVIPHEIRQYERITISRNPCVNCHLQPELIGQPVPAGEPTPIPADHYGAEPTSTDALALAGARWVCTQCHVPQANTPPLVGNTSVE
jgi:cytochrome c-type protein NapB